MITGQLLDNGFQNVLVYYPAAGDAGVILPGSGDGSAMIFPAANAVGLGYSGGTGMTTLEAADFNGDGVPDLWAVTPAGVTTAYRISQLSAKHAAVVTAGPPQKLVPPAPASG